MICCAVCQRIITNRKTMWKCWGKYFCGEACAKQFEASQETPE